MSDKTVNVKKGLEGVVVDATSISKVMPEINSLVYRGISGARLGRAVLL